MLSFLSSLPISVLRILDTEANKFYDRNHQLYDAALLTRCYMRIFLLISGVIQGIEETDLLVFDGICLSAES